MKNSTDNVFRSLSTGTDEPKLAGRFLNENDFSPHTRRAFAQDLRSLAEWFVEANKEKFLIQRVMTRDVADWRNHLRREKGLAVSTVNRRLVGVRKFFQWLVGQDLIPINPAKPVKELKMQELAPKGLERSQVRKLLREVELRSDIRANAIFSLFLYTGCRVSDLVALELEDVLISERSGSVTFKHGKGGKQRTVPLPSAGRKAVKAYLETRPHSGAIVFMGERGPLTDRGIRALCDRYSVFCGFKIHPHLLRHSFAHQFLANSDNDLVGLAQILGHSNLNTTARYTKRSESQLAEAAEKLVF